MTDYSELRYMELASNVDVSDIFSPWLSSFLQTCDLEHACVVGGTVIAVL